MPERTQFYKRGFVTSVRQHPAPSTKKREEEKEKPIDLGTDLKTVLAKTPSDRQKWLAAALKAAKEGKVKISLTALFDILAHRKFALGIPLGTGRKMRNLIWEQSDIFSAKQQAFLRSDKWEFIAVFGGEGRKDSRRDDDDDSSDDEKKAEDEPRGKIGFSMAAGSSGDAPVADEPADAPARDAQASSQAQAPELPPKVAKQRAPSPSQSPPRPVSKPLPPKPVSKPPPVKLPPKPNAAVLAAFATSEDDLVESRAEALAALRHTQRKSEISAVSDMPLSEYAERQILRDRSRSRSRSRDRDRDRRSGFDRDRRGGRHPLESELRQSQRSSRDDREGAFSQAAFQKRRAASDKNPQHEGLDGIKAEYLKKRGIVESERQRPRREAPLRD